MLWLSHRGESCDAPENTMRAFRLAWERGTDGIELDIRLTADSKLVCIHDTTTGRIGDKNLVVAESSYQELLSVNIGKNEKNPLLSQVLAEAPHNKLVYIELKAGKEILSPLLEVIAKSPVPVENLKIISFENDCLSECKKLIPSVGTYLLSEVNFDVKCQTLIPAPTTLLELKNKSGVNGFDLQACEKIDREYLAVLRKDNPVMPITVWTVNTPVAANYFQGIGVDAITSDRAAYLKKLLKN